MTAANAAPSENNTPPVGGVPPINNNAPPPVEKKVAPVPIKPVLAASIQPLGHRILELEVIVPNGTPREHLITAEFWMHALQKLQMPTILHCAWEDLSEYARIMCTFVNGRASHFVCLEHRVLEQLVATGQDFGPDFEVKQRGAMKWCVLDKHTGAVLKSMIATQSQALTEMGDLIKARAR